MFLKFDRNHSYLSDANYYVVIDDVVMGFSKVQNISMKQEREPLEEGGEGEGKRTVEKKEREMETLILEKGVARDWEGIVADNLIPGCEIDQLTIIVLKDAGQVAKAFYFESGVVTKRSFSNLDAASGDLLKVTLEISHSGLMEL